MGRRLLSTFRPRYLPLRRSLLLSYINYFSSLINAACGTCQIISDAYHFSIIIFRYSALSFIFFNFIISFRTQPFQISLSISSSTSSRPPRSDFSSSQTQRVLQTQHNKLSNTHSSSLFRRPGVLLHPLAHPNIKFLPGRKLIVCSQKTNISLKFS